MASKNLIVSVVIPAFNRSRELVTAVESVLAQTWLQREIIVVDDGSTDDTAFRMRPYRDKIRYVQQKNAGAAAARNVGLKMASGPWVAFLDSDDVWMPTKLAEQMKSLKEFDPAGVCFTDCEFFGNPNLAGSVFERAGFKSVDERLLIPDPMALIFGREPAFWIQSSVVRKRLLLELNGFDESLPVAEDTDLIFRLGLKGPFCVVCQPLVQISRPPERPVGLIEILEEKSDRSFQCRELMYRKWLRISVGVNEGARSLSLEHLKSLYYCWLIARFYRLRFLGCIENVRGLRACGETYYAILRRILSRARRRLGKTSQSLWGGHNYQRTDSVEHSASVK